MHFLDNPFFILNAEPCDNDARIMERAVTCGLFQDPDRCREAKAILMNPRKRIDAEIAWLPVKTRDQAKRICESLESSEANIDVLESLRQVEDSLGDGELVPIAKCNVLAAGLHCVRLHCPDAVATWTLEIARAYKGIDYEQASTDINADREEADVQIAKLENVKVAVRKSLVPYYDQAMKSAMVKLSVTERAEAMTRIVVSAKADDNQLPQLITTLGASYERDEEVRESLREHDTEVQQLVGQLQLAADANRPDSELAPLVNQLIQEVRDWDVIAQPIQLIKTSQGSSHDESETLARRVQNLVEHLFNPCDKLNLCLPLIRTLQEAFAEVNEISNRFSMLMSRLNETAQERERSARRTIESQDRQLRASAENQQPDSDLSLLVDQLIQSVRNWIPSARLCENYYADFYFEAVVNLVTELADDLRNEHGMFDVSRQLREMLQEELAQDNEFVARVDEPNNGLEDSPAHSALEEIESHVEELQACADARNIDSNWDRMLNELTELIQAWRALAMPIEDYSADYLNLVHRVVELAFQLRIAHGEPDFSRLLFRRLQEEFTEVQGYATSVAKFAQALEDAERARGRIKILIKRLREAVGIEPESDLIRMVNQLIQDVIEWKDTAQPIKVYYNEHYSLGANHVENFAFHLRDEQCRFDDSLKLFKMLLEEFADVDGIAARVAEPLDALSDLERARRDIERHAMLFREVINSEYFHPDLDRWVNQLIQYVERWMDLAPPMRAYCGDYADVANLVLGLAVNLRNRRKRRSSGKLHAKVQDIFGEIPEIETLLAD